MIVIIAKLKAVEGKADEVASLFRDMVMWVTENEEGTSTYACNRSSSDPNEFVFFERYRDQEAFEAHGSSGRFAKLLADLKGLVEGGVDMQSYQEVAAKL